MSIDNNAEPLEHFTGKISRSHFSPETGLEIAAHIAYDKLNEQRTVLIGVVGGSATGKTNYITPKLALWFDDVRVLAEDDYCLGNSGSARIFGVPNLRDISAYDPGLIYVQLQQLKEGYPIEKPQFAFDIRERRRETETVLPASIVIMEGSFLLENPMIDLFDITIFIDTDDHSRFVRRIVRPKRNPLQTDGDRLKEYCEWFYPTYFKNTLPMITRTDLVINNSYEPNEAIMSLCPSEPIRDLGSVVRRIIYTNPHMKDSENLSVTLLNSGLQILLYYPSVNYPGIYKKFEVNINDYELDLTRIGYFAYPEP